MSTLKLTTTPTALNPVKWDLELDENHQLMWTGFDRSDDVDQGEAIAQDAATRLAVFLGEWYQNLREGLPWRQTMFEKGTSLTVKRQIIREVIQGTPGVAEVTYLSIEEDPVSRTGTITFEALSDRGFTITQRDLDAPFIVGTAEGGAIG
jgi:hypothetical protein